MQQSPSEAILETLTDSGVLEVTADGISLTQAFRSEYESHVPPDDNPVSADTESTLKQTKYRVEGYEKALRTMDVSFDAGEIEVAARSLAMIGTDDSEMVRIEGPTLPDFLETHDRVVVLVTKADCTPCEEVQSKLTTIVTEEIIPEDVILVEVPGADAQRLLWEEYDVVGAPTLLFYRHGQVEMRLTGNPHLQQLRSDITRVFG